MRHVSFVDEYVGLQLLPADKKSLTLRLRLGSGERTLVRAEIDEAVRAVVGELAERFDAQWRDA